MVEIEFIGDIVVDTIGFEQEGEATAFVCA
jgi:hypothetical protein